jgi:hypothetical protein
MYKYPIDLLMVDLFSVYTFCIELILFRYCLVFIGHQFARGCTYKKESENLDKERKKGEDLLSGRISTILSNGMSFCLLS